MAASGSTTEEIGDYLAGETTPDAGTVSTTTSGGNVGVHPRPRHSRSWRVRVHLHRKFLEATLMICPQPLQAVLAVLRVAQRPVAHRLAAHRQQPQMMASMTLALSLPLWMTAQRHLTRLRTPEALQRRIERRGDYLTAPGGKLQPAGLSAGHGHTVHAESFYREDAGGFMREMAPLTGADITGVNKNAGLAGSDSGAFAVLTVDQMNELGASLNKKYGDSGYMNLGNMTPGAQAVAFSEISAKYPNQEYGRFDQRLGGQSIVRNMRLVGMNPETGSVMLEGGNKGFFGSGMASIFGLIGGSPISTGLSMGGTANRIKNAAMDSDTGSIIGIGLDTLGLPGSAANEGLRLAGVDVNRYLPQLDTSVASNTSIFSDTGDSGSDTPAARPDPVTEPTQRPDPGISVSVPTTAARSLVKRKRLPGQDVYGVTGSDFPFLSLSDELQTSGLSSAVKGRPGRFTQNRPR